MKKAVLLSIATIIISCTSAQNTKSRYIDRIPDLSKVTYEGGDGKTTETAIIIKNAENSTNGIAAEYDYIAKKQGEKFVDWKPLGQFTYDENKKMFDLISIETIPKKDTVSFVFDITEFYGKWD